MTDAQVGGREETQLLPTKLCLDAEIAVFCSNFEWNGLNRLILAFIIKDLPFTFSP